MPRASRRISLFLAKMRRPTWRYSVRSSLASAWFGGPARQSKVVSDSTKKEKLLRELKASLRSNDVDFNSIISIVNDVARADPDNVRFTVDAGLINRLGLELVSKQ